MYIEQIAHIIQSMADLTHNVKQGGFAICYEAENSRKQKFALKVVAKRSLRDHKLKTKFLAEINIHRSLKHPGIVRFHSCFEDSQNAYLVLELCENLVSCLS
jgi:serine/threonine protein kinase